MRNHEVLMSLMATAREQKQEPLEVLEQLFCRTEAAQRALFP